MEPKVELPRSLKLTSLEPSVEFRHMLVSLCQVAVNPRPTPKLVAMLSAHPHIFFKTVGRIYIKFGISVLTPYVVQLIEL
jgi:hypothetical protein